MVAVTIWIPFLMLILLGYSFGGAISHVPIAVVRDSYGASSISLLDILQAEQSCQFGGVNCQNSFQLVNVGDLDAAQDMLRESSVKAVVYVPPGYDAASGTGEVIAYLDTTDPSTAGTVSAELTQASQQLSIQASSVKDPQPNLVLTSLYQNISYIEYMAPSSAILAITYASAIGGGVTLLEDRKGGIIEGYLVTPLERYEIILGVILAGTVKALLSAGGMLLLAILIAGVHPRVDLLGAALMLVALVLTALGIISMITVAGIRASSPDVLRFLIAPIVLILYFTSGATYPVQGLPGWMREIAIVNPETYAFHALRLLMYKGTSLAAITGDLIFLTAFTFVMVVASTLAFRRSL
jgi:ABC-2 type transport system permease protein